MGKFGPKKSKLSVLSKNWHTWYLKEADSYSDIGFLNIQPKIHFGANLDQKKSKLSILSENWHTCYLEDADSYSEISYLNFKTQIYFWAELVPGSEIACFVWCSYTTYLKGVDLFYLKSVTGIITKQVCKCWQNSSKVSNESKKLSF